MGMQYIISPTSKPSPSPLPSGEGGVRFYAWFPAMHSRVDLLLAGDRSEADFLAIAKKVEATVADLERLANCYDPASPLARHNADASVQVPEALREMMDLCAWYKEQTFGLFDPWFDGRCNLSAFLKGYALDSLRPLLEHRGIRESIVNMGNSSIMYLAEGRVLTTSGNATAERRHIVDPATGRYVEGQRTLRVETPLVCQGPDARQLGGGALGEVLSTALFIADDDRRRQLLQRFPHATIVG